MSILAYDLIKITIGSETLYARPIKWDREDNDGQGNDINKNPISPIRYMATCPNCAQLLEFDNNQLYSSSNDVKNNIMCTLCKHGNNRIEADDFKSESDVVIVEDNQSKILDVFRDPISDGVFVYTVDIDKYREIE